MSSAGAPRSRFAWTPSEITGVVSLVVLGLIVTWDAWKDIAFIANKDEEQSHIFLVPVIALWLVWVRRQRLRRCPRDGRWIGPLFVGLGWALYTFGDLKLVQAFWHLGAIVVVVGCFLSFSGYRYLTRLAPAFVVLIFLVPVPGVIRQEIAMPLQTATADATQRILDLGGVDVVRRGNALTINDVNVQVAEACNGLRMVFALFLVSFAFAYTLPLREPVRAIILLLSPISAILCNVIRLVPTVWTFGFVSEEAGMRMHDIGGWVMLPIAFLLLLGVMRVLRWALVPVYRYTLAYGR